MRIGAWGKDTLGDWATWATWATGCVGAKERAAASPRLPSEFSARSPGRPVAQLSQIALQRPRPAHVAQTRQRLFLDLPHPLAGDAEQGADLLEGHRLAAV